MDALPVRVRRVGACIPLDVRCDSSSGVGRAERRCQIAGPACPPWVRTLGFSTCSTSRRPDSAPCTFMTGHRPSPDTWESRFGAALAHYCESADGRSPTRSHEAHSDLESRRATHPQGRSGGRRSGSDFACYQYRSQCRPSSPNGYGASVLPSPCMGVGRPWPKPFGLP